MLTPASSTVLHNTSRVGCRVYLPLFQSIDLLRAVQWPNCSTSSREESAISSMEKARYPPHRDECTLKISMQAKGGVDKYPAKSHARRVAEKLDHQSGIVILAATKNLNWPNSDMPRPFRQDRYFYYLTGCNEPDCWVTYDLKKDNLTLWLPPVDEDWRHVVYYGNGSTVEQALEKYDIDNAKYIKAKGSATDSLELLVSQLSVSSPSTSQHRSQDSFAGLESESMNDFTSRSGVRAPTENALRSAMDACRAIKDDHEIALVRRANEITTAAHVHVMKGIHAFDNEAQVEAAYMQTCIAQRAKEQAYDPICGSGGNASVLHYSENLAKFGKAQTIVIDAGCEVECYASDVTRTIPVNKGNPGYWPSKEAESIYKLVERVQESCIKQMLAGNRYIETQWHAHEIVVEGLLELGILQGDPQDIFHAGTSTAFLPHGLGHHVGLDVHDVSPVPHPPMNAAAESDLIQGLRQAYVKWKPESASYVKSLASLENFAFSRSSHALAQPGAPELEAGMIVTVEPGIYFNEYLLNSFSKSPQRKYINTEVLKRYIPVGGVRIEDDILITKHGYENLTTTPKGDEMLKIIRKGPAAGFR